MILRSVEDTLAWGKALAAKLKPGDALAFVGTLGAGKTHAVKGVVAGLGADADVSSPTFTLVHEYEGGTLPIFHFDFYRLDSSGEVIGIGWDDYLDAGGVVVVEWADRFPDLFPPHTQWYQFTIQEDGARKVEPMPMPQ